MRGKVWMVATRLTITLTAVLFGLWMVPGISAAAEAVAMVMQAHPGTVFDEINLTPLKKVIQFRQT